MTDSRNDSKGRAGVLSAGRHPVNIGHLVMGLAFLGLVGIWSLIVNDVVDDNDIRWLLPVPWVLAGLGGLAALAVSGSRRYATRANGWVDTPASEPEDPVEPTDPEPKP
ncbi:hypothetical protein [Nocardioides dilutus]